MAAGFPGRGFGTAHAAGNTDTAALARQSAWTDLARTALLGTAHRPLMEKAAQLVLGALGAESCGIYEYLPGGQHLILQAAAFAPGSRRGLTTVDLTGAEATGLVSDSHGRTALTAALVVPIGVEPPFGCMAARAGEHRGFDDGDRHFAVQAAGILDGALARLLAEEDRRLASLRDPLTGLPNRSLILDHLRLALSRSERRPSTAAVLFVDLDGFKLINDTLGHQAGDDLLIAVGQRLRGALRPPDTVGRLGGDEFVAVCEDVDGPAGAAAVAERLAATLEDRILVAGREVQIQASIGVSVSTGAGTDPATLLSEADGAMFWAKRRGRRVALFDERMRVGTDDLLSPGERTGAGLTRSQPHHPAAGLTTSATAGRLLARMTQLLEDIENSEGFEVPRSADLI